MGASVGLGIDTPNLEEAYQAFKDEALQLNPEYQPETVNTDGWRHLFPQIVILKCCLHAFIKIRQRAKHMKDSFHLLSQKVGEVYHAVDAAAFRLQATELLTWAETNTGGYVLDAVRKLCSKVDRFRLAYDHPLAHRTSNMLDRWLDSSRFFSRALDICRAFHPSLGIAARLWSLLPASQGQTGIYFACP